jgi:hypothetical protein
MQTSIKFIDKMSQHQNSHPNNATNKKIKLPPVHCAGIKHEEFEENRGQAERSFGQPLNVVVSKKRSRRIAEIFFEFDHTDCVVEFHE